MSYLVVQAVQAVQTAYPAAQADPGRPHCLSGGPGDPDGLPGGPGVPRQSRQGLRRPVVSGQALADFFYFIFRESLKVQSTPGRRCRRPGPPDSNTAPISPRARSLVLSAVEESPPHTQTLAMHPAPCGGESRKTTRYENSGDKVAVEGRPAGTDCILPSHLHERNHIGRRLFRTTTYGWNR